jgi:hypothetical protein
LTNHCQQHEGNLTSLSPTFSQSIFRQGRMQLSSLLLPGVFATALAQHNLSDAQAACERLGSTFNAPHVTVNLAQYVAAGTNISLPEQGTGAASCGNTAQIVSVDLCRIAANVATSNRSEITMEAWLPTNWLVQFRWLLRVSLTFNAQTGPVASCPSAMAGSVGVSSMAISHTPLPLVSRL